MNKDIAITLLTWNDWKNTVECLESIFQSDYQNFDVVLVNNGSEKFHIDKIIEWSKNKIKVSDEEFIFNPNKDINIHNVTNEKKKISEKYKNIYLINLKENIGLAAGVNIGLRFAIENNYDVAARIDCDFIITKNYLSKMISMFNNNKEIIASSPKIKHAFYRHTVWWCGFKHTWSYLKFQRTMNLKKKRIIDNENLKGLIDTDAVTGSCSMYKTSSLKISGLEDEEFFFGPDDAEFSYRLKKFGKLIVNLDAITFHKIAKSIEVSGWYFRAYNETKGFLMLIEKTGTLSDKIFGYLYHILRIPYFFLLLILKKRSKERVYCFSKGCNDIFFK